MATPSTDVTKPLSAAAVQAAALDAQGLSVNDIAAATGLTRQTVSAYRNNDPRYLELRTKFLAEAVETLTDQMNSARVEALAAFRKAITRMSEHLDAEIDGIPLVKVQQEAAKALFAPAVLKFIALTLEEAGGKKDGAAGILPRKITIIVEQEDEPVEDAEVTEVDQPALEAGGDEDG